MQSYLQYRRLGNAVHRQLNDAPERGAAPSVNETPHETAVSTPSDQTDDDVTESESPALAQKPTQYSEKTAFGRSLAGVDIKKQLDSKSHIFVVGWEDENDPLNPRNHSTTSRMVATLLVTALAFIVGAASAIESGVLPQITETYHVSEVVGSLVTGKSSFLATPWLKANIFQVSTCLASPLVLSSADPCLRSSAAMLSTLVLLLCS
jgi:hypothetical protein